MRLNSTGVLQTYIIIESIFTVNMQCTHMCFTCRNCTRRWKATLDILKLYFCFLKHSKNYCTHTHIQCKYTCVCVCVCMCVSLVVTQMYTYTHIRTHVCVLCVHVCVTSLSLIISNSS